MSGGEIAQGVAHSKQEEVHLPRTEACKRY